MSKRKFDNVPKFDSRLQCLRSSLNWITSWANFTFLCCSNSSKLESMQNKYVDKIFDSNWKLFVFERDFRPQSQKGTYSNFMKIYCFKLNVAFWSTVRVAQNYFCCRGDCYRQVVHLFTHPAKEKLIWKHSVLKKHIVIHLVVSR